MQMVVIGGVAAGLSAAARARKLDPGMDITVLEKGDTISQGLCGLPYYVENRVAHVNQLLRYTPESFARERKVSVRTGTEVVRIHHGQRRVILAGGDTVRYERLVVATGARPIREIDGADQPHVFTLQSLDDGRRLKAFVEQRRPRRGLVIGAGYIGLETAEALRAQGVSVTIVDRAPHPFGCANQDLTRIVCAHLERCGISTSFGQRLNAVPDGYDIVVLALGLRPNIELAAEAGIEIGRTGAIHVDERMETNLTGIYAAGDCAESRHLVTGRPVWLPLGSTANKMGRVAGANIAGRRERFPGVAGTSIVSVCGLAIGITGVQAGEARENGFDPVTARIESRDRAGYFQPRPVIVELTADRRSSRLIGAAIIGEREVAGRVNAAAVAITRAMTVEDFAQLDLAYAPPFSPVWDPLLIAAQQLMHAL